MQTSLFDFTLPESLIATRPASPRDAARMLAVSDTLRDCHARDLPSFLREGDVLVVNDTRVIPARLHGLRGAVKIELLLHKQQDESHWRAFARPAKRLKPEDVITFPSGHAARVLEKNEGEVLLHFPDAHAAMEACGEMPLPPYIAQLRPADARDAEDYQTLYAAHAGSVAAPTAGLHFTPELWERIGAMGVERAALTLHVGGGTFLPVKADDTAAHRMHSEYAEISAETAATINRAKQRGGRIIAVGTTACRALESAADAQGAVHPFRNETDIFITPGYRFKCVDMLLTNFHLPRSTLFMLVSAFAGRERMQAAYAHAIAQGYRFYSYGDACLLQRAG